MILQLKKKVSTLIDTKAHKELAQGIDSYTFDATEN
jgi:dipeptidyl-peptidase-4